MSNHQSLKSLARMHGISLRRPSADGSTAPVNDSTLRKLLSALKVATDEIGQSPPQPTVTCLSS